MVARRVCRAFAAAVLVAGGALILTAPLPSPVAAQRPGKPSKDTAAVRPLAEFCPDCPPPIYAVDVFPDNEEVFGVAAGATRTFTFWVTNSGNTTDAWDMLCSTTGNVSCVSVFPTRRLLGAEQRVQVSVTFRTGPAGTTGTVFLQAYSIRSSDFGHYNVFNAAGTKPGVALRNQNGDHLDRALCLTSGAGEAAAWQCGDLVVTHGLPGYATMGRERSLTLLYYSNQAVPTPVVAAAVTQASAGSLMAPDTIYAELRVNGAVRSWGKFGGWAQGPLTRQIALTYNAQADTTGIYPFTLLMRNQYGATGIYDSTVSGALLVVNRGQSRFGAGWSLVGVEQLVTAPGGQILWVGGDGSAKVYAPVSANVWVAPPGAYRDTLVYDPATGVYTRTLRHRIQVKFNTAGRHIETVNRMGQRTTFSWSDDTLKSITVPPAGASGTTYTLLYDGNGKLDRITDPAGRVLDVTVANNRLTAFLDPDGYGPSFGYDIPGRMTSRLSRRGFVTQYGYNRGVRITSVQTPAGATVFEPWDQKSLSTSWAPSTAGVAVDTALAYTKIDGPRPAAVGDTAEFWVDRWGAPARIKDPLGGTTTVVRGDAASPALVTQVTSPDGRIVKLTWDARRNLVETRDSTLHLSNGQPTAVSTWSYLSPTTKDAPDRSTDPEGLVTRYVYNTWGLMSQATAPNGHVTDFEFVPSGTFAGLVRAVIERNVPIWDTILKTEAPADQRTAFALNTLGNVVGDTSPMLHARTYTRDAVERVANVYDPAGHRTEIVYDALNRVLQSIRHPHPSDPTFTTPLVTRQYWGIDVVDSIVDPRGVRRGYRYDAANRRTQEIDDYGHIDATFYNPAGLIDSVRLRFDEGTTGFVTRFTYDAAGRVQKKKWPARSPLAADSIVYAYDVMGRVLTATQSNRKVARTYFPTGTLRTETQSHADSSSPYLNTYAYDRAGRRLWYRIGSGALADSVWYTYAPISGDLKTIGVRWSSGVLDSVLFRWDALGRRDTVIYHKILNVLRVNFAYDGDGQLRLVCGSHGGGPVDDVFDFTVYHKTADMDGLIKQTTNWSSGLTGLGCGQNQTMLDVQTNTYDSRHQLLTQKGVGGSSQYTYDGSGNIVRFTTNTSDKVHVIDPGHNRLTRWYYADNPGVGTDYLYDWSGNRLEEIPFCPGCNPDFIFGRRGYYYDGLGRTTGTQEQACQEDPNGGCSGTYPVDQPNVCKYDPLGRLFDRCEGGGSTITYLGYDLDNVVRTAEDGRWYRWSFVHGPGLDDPVLAFWRGNVPENNRYWYYVTDGQGRQFAVGDANGYNMSTDIAYYQNGGKFAGGTKNANSFSIDRNHNPEMYKLSFFRNRFYDQATGRWTQEDPIGVAGGVNLYAYGANNPVSNLDPFGLKVCFSGTRAQQDSLRRAFEDATNTIIVVDKKGCVAQALSRGRAGFEEIQQRFQAMIKASETFEAVLVDGPSRFNSVTLKISISRSDEFYYLPGGGAACVNLRWLHTLGAKVAHEAVGHGYHVTYGAGSAIRRMEAEDEAIRIQNQYHRARNEPQRCNEMRGVISVAPADGSRVVPQ